jgi:hypothetical protein
MLGALEILAYAKPCSVTILLVTDDPSRSMSHSTTLNRCNPEVQLPHDKRIA